jgi:hypothetical protein
MASVGSRMDGGLSQVFCVQCGANTVQREGELYCERGRMSYGQVLLAEIQRGMAGVAGSAAHPIDPTALYCSQVCDSPTLGEAERPRRPMPKL